MDSASGRLSLLMWAPVKPRYSVRVSLYDGSHLVQGDVEVSVNATLDGQSSPHPWIDAEVQVDVNSEDHFDAVVANVALETLSHQLSPVLVYYPGCYYIHPIIL